MDFKRIDAELWNAISAAPFSPEVDNDILRGRPWLAQEQRAQEIREYLPPPPEGVTVKNIFISSTGNDRLRLRVYIPGNRTLDGVLLYFHGGGYIFGLPEQNDFELFDYCRDLGVVIVSADYRLVPQNRFPAALEDARATLYWLYGEGQRELNINPDKIVVAGDSAGGHLAASLTQYTQDYNGPAIHGQFLLYPMVSNMLPTASKDMLPDAPFVKTEMIDICWTHMLGQNRRHQSVPYADLLHKTDLSNLPPAVIVIAELDPIRDEGIAYATRLIASGVPVDLRVIRGATHLFNVFDCAITREYRIHITTQLRHLLS